MSKVFSHSEIRCMVREIVAEQFCFDSIEQLDDYNHFIRDYGADFYDLSELIIKFEKKFNIKIHTNFFILIQTVNEAVYIISEILNREEA